MMSSQSSKNAEQAPLFSTIEADQDRRLKKIRRYVKKFDHQAAWLEANKDFLTSAHHEDPIIERTALEIKHQMTEFIPLNSHVHYHNVYQWAARLFEDKDFDRLMNIPTLSRKKVFDEEYVKQFNHGCSTHYTIKDNIKCNECRTYFIQFSRIVHFAQQYHPHQHIHLLHELQYLANSSFHYSSRKPNLQQLESQIQLARIVQARNCGQCRKIGATFQSLLWRKRDKLVKKWQWKQLHCDLDTDFRERVAKGKHIPYDEFKKYFHFGEDCNRCSKALLRCAGMVDVSEYHLDLKHTVYTLQKRLGFPQATGLIFEQYVQDSLIDKRRPIVAIEAHARQLEINMATEIIDAVHNERHDNARHKIKEFFHQGNEGPAKPNPAILIEQDRQNDTGTDTSHSDTFNKYQKRLTAFMTDFTPIETSTQLVEKVEEMAEVVREQLEATGVQFFENSVNQSEHGQLNKVEIPLRNEHGITPNARPNQRVAAPVATADTTNIVGRPYLVKTGVLWDATQQIGTVIMTTGLPGLFFQNNLAPIGLLQWHAFQHVDFDVEIRINPTAFHAGTLMLFWVPGFWHPQNEGNAWGGPDTLATLTQYEHAILNVGGEETTAKIRVPYSYMYRMMRNAERNEMGQLNIIVWNTLSTASSNTNSLELSVWIEPIDPILNVKIPLAINQPFMHSVNQSDSEHSSVLASVEKGIGSLVNPDAGTISNISNLVKTVAGIAGNFDSPTVPLDDECNLAITDNARHARSLHYHTGDASANMKEATSNAVQDYSIRSRCSIPSRMTTIVWENTLTAGTLIYRIPVKPSYCGTVSQVPPYINYNTTSLAFFSQMFQYWRGSLHYTLEIIATKFHQGQLYIVFVPAIDGPSPTFQETWTCTNAVLDIGKNNRLEFEIPFVNDTDYALTDPLSQLSYDNAIGTFEIYIQNALNAPGNVKNSVDINVYINAGSDFTFAVPRDYHFYDDEPSGITIFIQGDYQADTNEEPSSTANEDSIVVKAFDTSKPAGGFISTSHDYILDLLRRPDAVAEIALKDEPIGTIIAKFTGISGETHRAISMLWTYWSGSQRYHFISSSSKASNIILRARLQLGYLGTSQALPPGSIDNSRLAFNGAVYLPINTTNAHTVHLPYYRIAPIQLTDQTGTTSTKFKRRGNSAVVLAYLSTSQTTSTFNESNLTVLHSIGDDTNFYLQRAFPKMRFQVPGELDALEIQRFDDFELQSDYGPAEEQGLGDMARGISSFLHIANDVGKAVSVGQSVKDWIDWQGEKIRISSLADWILNIAQQLPAILTACHTVATGNIGFKLIGCLSIVQSAYNILTRGPAKILQGLQSDYRDVLSSIQTFVKSVGGVTSELFAQATNMIHSIAPKLCDGAFLVLSTCMFFINSAAYSLGLKAGVGSARFLIRTCGKPDDSPAYFINVVYNSFRYLFFGESLNLEWENERLKAYHAIITKYTALSSKRYFDSANVTKIMPGETESGFDILSTLHAEAQTIISEVDFVRVPQMWGTVVGKISADLASAYALRDNSGSQPEPTCIAFVGGSGTGKSVLISSLFATVLVGAAGLLPDGVDPKTLVYRIPGGKKQAFWDLYAKHPVCFIDEFLQDREGGDILDFLTLVSSAKNAINCASLKDKNQTFESPFILVASNMDNINTVGTAINRPEAVLRRFAKTVKVEVTAQYRTPSGTLNYTAVAQALKVADDAARLRILNSIWKLTEWDMRNGRPANMTHTTEITFSELIAFTVAEYRNRTARFDELSGIIEGIARATAVLQSDTDGEATENDSDTDMLTEMDDFNDLFGWGHDNLHEDPITMLIRDVWLDHNNLSARDAIFYRDMLRGYDVLRIDELPEDFVLRECSTPSEYLAYVTKIAKEKQRKRKLFIGLGAILGTLTVGAAAFAIFYRTFRTAFETLWSVFQSYTKEAKPQPKIAKSYGQALTQSDGAISAVQRNIRQARIVGDDGFMDHFHVFFLDNRTCLSPAHVFKKFNPNEGHYFQVAERGMDGGLSEWQTHDVTQSKQLTVQGDVRDVLLLHFTTTHVTRARNIWNLIVKESKFTSLVGSRLDMQIVETTSARHPRTAITGKVAGFAQSINQEQVAIASTVDEQTVAGDCGRPYVLTSAHHNEIVFAIHASLYINHTIVGGAPVTYEACKAALDSLHAARKPVLDFEDVDLQSTPAQSQYWTCNLELTKTTVNGHTISHHGPTQSSLIPVIHNGEPLKHEEWVCEMAPARMKPYNGKHPMLSNAQKYEIVAPVVPGPLLHNTIVDHFCTKIIPAENISPLTDHEVINGVGTIQPLVLKTGCGYWTDLGYADGKREFFNALPQQPDQPIEYEFSEKAHNFIVPLHKTSFVRRIRDCEVMLEQGTVPFHIWTSTLKDELLTLVKVNESVKTRVFEQPGLDFTFLFRKYFGRFLDWYKARPGFTLGHGIGCDKETAWKAYAEGFLANSNVGHAFDYTNYDGSVWTPCFEFFLDVTDYFYMKGTVGQRNARHALIEMLRCGIHSMKEFTFFTHQGNKSGNPATDVFNSMTNMYIMYTSFLLCSRLEGRKETLLDFDDGVRILTYGDDAMATVKPHLLEFWNGPFIQEALAIVGSHVTSAAKSAVIEHHVTFSEMTFLKSGFREEDGVWFAPMTTKDIYKELCWQPKNTAGDAVDLQQRIMVTTRFMAHHGKEAFLQFKEQLASRGIPPSWLTLRYETVWWEIREKQRAVELY
jgi:hypothetical protein